MGVSLVVCIDHIQSVKVICYGLGHTVAALHPGGNPLAHRIEEPSNLTGEQHPALPIGDGTPGPDMGHQPFFCLDLLTNLQTVMFLHVRDKPMIERLNSASVLDRNTQHQHFIFRVKPRVILKQLP